MVVAREINHLAWIQENVPKELVPRLVGALGSTNETSREVIKGLLPALSMDGQHVCQVIESFRMASHGEEYGDGSTAKVLVAMIEIMMAFPNIDEIYVSLLESYGEVDISRRRKKTVTEEDEE